MKILFVSLGVQTDTRDALSDYGEVIYWDWTKEPRAFNRNLKNIYDSHLLGKGDLVFMQIQTPGIISVQMANYINKSFVVNWTGDVRFPLPNWFIEIGRCIDLTLFSNMTDAIEARRRGINADYLQIGLPDKIFKPKGEIRKEADILFMGNNVGHFPLSGLRIQMVNELAKRYSNFKCYGTNWPRYSYEPNQLEEAKIYRGGKIGINLSHFLYDRYSSDRILRMMGSGIMCLSHYYPGIDLEFEIGKHLDVWHTLPELYEKIDYYMINEKERLKIAKSGCEHVHKNHTWRNRIKDLSSLVNPK